jgi:hypothetical protein
LVVDKLITSSEQAKGTGVSVKIRFTFAVLVT